MNTQATAAKKPTAAQRKAAAAAKFAENALAAAAEEVVEPAAVEAAPVDPATVPTGLKKAKAATKRASRALVVKVEGGATETEQMASAVNVLQAKANAQAKRAAAKKAREVEFVPVVVKDANNHSAIAVSSNGRTVELIPMDSAGMAVTKLSADRFATDYKPMQDYPVEKAAKVYLTQTIAMDPKAKAVLEVLAASEADKPIASGVLVALMSKHDEAAVQTAPATEGSAPAAAAPARQPRAKKHASATEPRESKPTGSRASATEQAKTIVAGDVKVASKVQPGSFRAARHEYIVSMAGKTVAEVLGAATVEGKRGIAYRDIQFAVSHGFIKLA